MSGATGAGQEDGDGGHRPPSGAALELAVSGGVAWLTIDNRAQANALTSDMLVALAAAWDEVERRRDVRVAVLTGAGEQHFCAGMAFDAMGGGALAGPLRLSPRQCGVSKPVIAAVNGAVVGGAIAFVVDADVTLATWSSYFSEPHVSLGLVTGYAALRLARALPPGEARRLVLGGADTRLTADRAFALGLVNELVGDVAELRGRAEKLAASVAAQSPAAVRASLRYLREMAFRPEHLVLADALAMAKEHLAHPDATEGLAARRERRTPRWAEP